MKVNHQYIPGWIDTSIHDFLLDITEISSGMSYTIIACLDSCSEVSSMVKKSKHFQSVIKNYTAFGDFLLVKTKDLISIEHDNRIFFGFDEICFIPQKSAVSKNLENGTNSITHNLVELQNQQMERMDFKTVLTLVGPCKLESTSIQKLVDLMQPSNISCILGDGVGMNYLLKKSQQTLMSYLLKAHNQNEGNLIYTETK